MNLYRYYLGQFRTRPALTTFVAVILIELFAAALYLFFSIDQNTRREVLQWSLAFVVGALSSAVVGVVQSYQASNRINQQFNMMKATTEAGILNIFEKREDAVQTMREAIRKSRHVNIMAVAGNEYLPENEFGDELYPDNPKYARTAIRLLLLDPTTNYALERSNREAPTREIEAVVAAPRSNSTEPVIEYDERDLFRKIRNSVSVAQRLKKEYDRENKAELLNVRLYNSEPHFHIVDTEDDLFVEFYHLGRTPEHEEKVVGVCLGGKVPVFHIYAHSDLGKQLRNHFEYMWERSSKRIMSSNVDLARGLAAEVADQGFLARFLDEWGHTMMAARPRAKPNTDRPGQGQRAL